MPVGELLKLDGALASELPRLKEKELRCLCPAPLLFIISPLVAFESQQFLLAMCGRPSDK